MKPNSNPNSRPSAKSLAIVIALIIIPIVPPFAAVQRASLGHNCLPSSIRDVETLTGEALAGKALAGKAQAGPLSRIRSRREARRAGSGNSQSNDFETCKIAGRDVAFWIPKRAPAPWPVVVFSHGFHGMKSQSEFITRALADEGYLVVAPDHQDAMGKGKLLGRPEEKFKKSENWTDQTYRQRGQDLVQVIEAIKSDPQWQSRADFSRLVLMGHSLGGYTVMALAGAWPSWKLPGVRAVVALSPYAAPFVRQGTLANLGAPIMYQTGTRDLGIAPFLKGNDGAYFRTPSPAYLIELQGANHFTWTNLNKQKSREKLINHYVLSFLDRYVKGESAANPGLKLPGIASLLYH